VADLDLDVVARAAATRSNAVGYRNQAPGFDPRSGEGARRMGGRYNPPRSFPVVYLCTTRACVVAELHRQAERQGLEVVDLLPRELWRLSVVLERLLDLTDAGTLDALGVRSDVLVGDDRSLTRQLGEAAYARGFQAILSPSATGVDLVLAVFPENLDSSSVHVSQVETWTVPADLD
jgi:RES domain-containing protein